MGCSSSTQNIAQEGNRPGTKPEEGKRNALLVACSENGTVGDDSQPISEQIVLSVQSNLPEDPAGQNFEEPAEIGSEPLEIPVDEACTEPERKIGPPMLHWGSAPELTPEAGPAPVLRLTSLPESTPELTAVLTPETITDPTPAPELAFPPPVLPLPEVASLLELTPVIQVTSASELDLTAVTEYEPSSSSELTPLPESSSLTELEVVPEIPSSPELTALSESTSLTEPEAVPEIPSSPELTPLPASTFITVLTAVPHPPSSPEPHAAAVVPKPLAPDLTTTHEENMHPQVPEAIDLPAPEQKELISDGNQVIPNTTVQDLEPSVEEEVKAIECPMEEAAGHRVAAESTGDSPILVFSVNITSELPGTEVKVPDISLVLSQDTESPSPMAKVEGDTGETVEGKAIMGDPAESTVAEEFPAAPEII